MVNYIASTKGGKIPYKNMIEFNYRFVIDEGYTYIYITDVEGLHKKLFEAVVGGVSFYCFYNRIYIDFNNLDCYFVIGDIDDYIFENIKEKNIFNICAIKSFQSTEEEDIVGFFGCDDLKFI